MSLQTIWKYDIASKVPIHGEISFKELAEKCGLTEVNLRRILRYAMAFHHVFKEPRKGSVAHTAASRKLLEDPFTRDGCGYMFDEVWQSFAHVCHTSPIFPFFGLMNFKQTVPALEKFEEGDEPNQTVSSMWILTILVAHGLSLGMEYLSGHRKDRMGILL